VHLLDFAPRLLREAAQRRRESLKKTARTVEGYLEMLEKEA